MKEMELYLHIPFCVKKCGYCDFLSFPAGKEAQKSYKEALLREIKEAGERVPGVSGKYHIYRGRHAYDPGFLRYGGAF